MYGKYFIDFVKKNGRSYRLNTLRLQGDKSTTCGNWALWFIKKRMANISFDNIINEFSINNTKQNDKKVTSFVNKIVFSIFSDCTKQCCGECYNNKNRFTNVCVQTNLKCNQIIP